MRAASLSSYVPTYTNPVRTIGNVALPHILRIYLQIRISGECVVDVVCDVLHLVLMSKAGQHRQDIHFDVVNENQIYFQARRRVLRQRSIGADVGWDGVDVVRDVRVQGIIACRLSATSCPLWV